jgi:hypothetical protein
MQGDSRGMKEMKNRAMTTHLIETQPHYLLTSFMCLAVLLVLLSLPAFAGQKASLTKERAQGLLGPILQGAKVVSVSASPLEGAWEVVIAAPGGEKSVVYFDDKRMLLVSGALIDLKTRSNLTKSRYEEVNRVDFSSIPLDDALVMGNREAKYKVVVFDDPD